MLLCVTLNPAFDLTMQLDTLSLGQVNKHAKSTLSPAGKGINVATILTQLGAKVAVTGFLGCDNQAAFIDQFATLGVDNHFVSVKGSTRHNVKIAHDRQVTDINSTGFTVTPDDIKALMARIIPLAKTAQAVVVSGSLPVGFTQDDFRELLLAIKAHSLLIVDTSGAALATAIACRPFLIKPNDDEIAALYGKLSDEATATLAQQLGIDNVVVSLGARGVCWSMLTHTLSATAPKVEILSTVGAGDTLTAVLVFGLMANQDKTKLLTQAVATASYATTQVGVGLPSDDTLAILSRQIHISHTYPLRHQG